MWANCRRQALVLALFLTLGAMAAVPSSEAGSAAEIDAGVRQTLNEFYSQVRGSRQLVAKSAAILVSPSVIKAGFGIGGA
jgi:lipid-binding SYLF domain-containing protein